MSMIKIQKKLNEIIPGWIKLPFSRIIRGKLINNKTFQRQYNELLLCDAYSEEEKKKCQSELLRKLFLYVYENSPYYKRIMNENKIDPYEGDPYKNLSLFPLLTKEDVKQNLSEISVPEIEDFYEVTTGGTTGEPIKVYMAKDAIYKEWAFVYHYWAKYGYDYKKSKVATFRGMNLGKKICEINPLYQEIRMNPFIMNEANIQQYVSKIQKYGAEFIYGYPSAIYNYCRLCKKTNLNQLGRYKAALLISENLYAYQEMMIKEVLGCKIAIFYGHSERAVFAEKNNIGYAFNSLYGVTEISSEGYPIVTGFINKKVPLIRYVVDDYISGSEGEYIIQGHHGSEVLIGNNDERISMAAINFHDDTFANVQEYQFVQDKVGQCILKIVPNSQLSENEIRKIKKRVETKLGNGFSCEVIQVHNIVLTSRGKYRMLIQKLDIV